MTEYRFSKDAESLASLATEGSLLAEGLAESRTTSAFVLSHAQELASESEKLATVVDSTRPEPGLETKSKRLVLLARRASTQLRLLADHASDPAVAAEVRAALKEVAGEAEELEKNL
jgi:hypothetical protein